MFFYFLELDGNATNIGENTNIGGDTNNPIDSIYDNEDDDNPIQSK